jgi:hypothetical protein
MNKVLLFFLCGFLPILAFSISLLLSFPLLGALAVAIIIAILFIAAGIWITGSNVWIKSVENNTPVVLSTSSTGVGDWFNIRLETSPITGGKDIIQPDGSKLSYDRAITQLVKEPKTGYMHIIKIPDEKTGELKKFFITALPAEDYYKHNFNIDNKTFLFYDQIANVYLPKPLLGEQEKEIMFKWITTNELREIKELNRTMREFMRFTMDLIADRFSRLLNSWVFKMIILVVVIVVVIVLVIQFAPGVTNMLMPAIQQTTGQIVQPIKSALPVTS